jgi:hypothetical protein
LPSIALNSLLQQINNFDHEGALATLTEIAAQLRLPLDSTP